MERAAEGEDLGARENGGVHFDARLGHVGTVYPFRGGGGEIDDLCGSGGRIAAAHDHYFRRVVIRGSERKENGRAVSTRAAVIGERDVGCPGVSCRIEKAGASGRARVKDFATGKHVHAWVERRSPGGREGRAPAGTGAVELDGSVGAAGFAEAREYHGAAVAENGAGGIPAAVRHGLLVDEGVGSRVIGGGAQLAVERIVLEGAAHDEGTAVGEDHHAVAEHVPGYGLGGYGAGLGIPKSGLEIIVAGDVAGARDD